jgi:2-methylisocitrate lyase-like PEP mutase family enzyme
MTGMERRAQVEPAARLRGLHQKRPLVLPNAWDAGSARVIEAAGAAAIATTSAGIAWAHGYPDGQELAADEMLRAIESIVAAVRVPVTADVESGYGDGSPTAVAGLVGRLLDVGVAGINIEDSPGPDGRPLRSTAQQVERLRAAREAAGADLVVNARTDGYLLGVGSPEARLDDTVDRANAYVSAGADCVFVPGVVRPDTIRELAARIPAPLNVMAGPGAPPVTELAALGVARVSVGPALTVAAYDLVSRAARDLLENGAYTGLDVGLGFGDLNGLFDR